MLYIYITIVNSINLRTFNPFEWSAHYCLIEDFNMPNITTHVVQKKHVSNNF